MNGLRRPLLLAGDMVMDGGDSLFPYAKRRFRSPGPSVTGGFRRDRNRD